MEINQIREKFINIINRINEMKLSNELIGIDTIILYWCEFGEAMSELKKYYHINGFPVKNNDITLSKIWTLDSFSNACRLSLRDLEKRNCFEDIGFLDQINVGDLFYELSYSCCSGNYDVPVNSNVAKLKKILLSELISLSYDCLTSNEEKRKFYDSKDSLEKIQEYFQIYKEYVGVQCRNYKVLNNNELICVYEGPQFGNEINNLIDYLNVNTDKIDGTKRLEKIN